MANNYSKLSKEDLLKTIEKLETRKKYGLIWDEERTKEHFEKESQNALPVLKEVKNKEIKTNPALPINILIEGDNYHALSVLNYTHQGKIDVIYADPPYNTGSNTWKYNNNYVNKDDAFRHSKWLSFMSKRLRLAKNLLKEDGIFVITIDDYEIFTLGLLADEIFGENNRIGILVMEVNPRGRTTNKFFATSHEYALFYAKNADLATIHDIPLNEEQAQVFNLKDDISRYRLLPFRRSGGLSTPAERPNSYYPIYYNEKEDRISIEKKKGYAAILPLDSTGKKRVWRQTRPSLQKAIERGDMVIKKGRNQSYTVYMKDRIKSGRKPKTVWIDPSYDASSHGTVLLQRILGKRKAFDYPKSLYSVRDVLNILLVDRKDAVVLDFFAGSGTTGHAILELNKKNNSLMQFILCTNDENGICKDVCYPRINKVIKGYKRKNKTIKGLESNLKYFQTSFVKKTINKDDLKIRITQECTDMLCLREMKFNEIKRTNDYRIFRNNGDILAVYYSLSRSELRNLKRDLDKLEGKKILYCFTLDPLGLDKNDFQGWENVSLEPIPQKILDIYEEIYEY